GTLARAPIDGTGPRGEHTDILDADFVGDGDMALARLDGTIEYPAGTTRFRSTGPVSFVRASPDGRRLAFVHRLPVVEESVVMLVEPDGSVRQLGHTWTEAPTGLAWRSKDELWISGRSGDGGFIAALGVGGGERILLRAPERVALNDIAADGRSLVSLMSWREVVMARPRDAEHERDVSWRDASHLQGLFPDGEAALFVEEAAGGGVYLRRFAD